MVDIEKTSLAPMLRINWGVVSIELRRPNQRGEKKWTWPHPQLELGKQRQVDTFKKACEARVDEID